MYGIGVLNLSSVPRKPPNIDLLSGNNTLLKINIEPHWKFFFIRPVQPYLCMQDGIITSCDKNSKSFII